MHRLAVFFGSVLNTSNSETYMLWGSIVAKLACLVPVVCAAEQSLAGALHVSPDVMFAGAITYAVGRMVSKAAKAPTK